MSIQGLIEHGPLRPEALRGLTTPETYNPACEMLKQDELIYANPKPGSNQIEKKDPQGFRTGICPN